MSSPTLGIIGGGAAGFFAAITAAEAGAKVHVFEQSGQFLTKVAKSGGGRCNVTHACFEPRQLAMRYPRGERALIGAFHHFQARETVEWFESRGVRLKTEADGRMFPVSDQSASIVDCLLDSARAAGVHLHLKSPVDTATHDGEKFSLALPAGPFVCDRILLATGGSRVPSGARIAEFFGHRPVPPVPSLFSFDMAESWVKALAGVACEAEVCYEKLKQRGPVLFTHRGLSGPAILRLSAWGARELETVGYRFPIRVNFFPGQSPQQVESLLQAERDRQPGKKVVNIPLGGLPVRLWEQLCHQAGVPEDARWTTLPRAARLALAEVLTRAVLRVEGKSLNKDEFVTCGGIDAREVDFRTMESRLRPGLYFAGELLNVDGITGGFNFQAAWTTGWLAGRAMARDMP